MNSMGSINETEPMIYAKRTFKASLISSLKKLSRNSLSNLTPHSIILIPLF